MTSKKKTTITRGRPRLTDDDLSKRLEEIQVELYGILSIPTSKRTAIQWKRQRHLTGYRWRLMNRIEKGEWL